MQNVKKKLTIAFRFLSEIYTLKYKKHEILPLFLLLNSLLPNTYAQRTTNGCI